MLAKSILGVTALFLPLWERIFSTLTLFWSLYFRGMHGQNNSAVSACGQETHRFSEITLWFHVKKFFILIRYITSQIVLPTKQIENNSSLHRKWFFLSIQVQFLVTHNEPCTVLGMGSRGPGEQRGKLMWPATVPFAHIAALWTPHLICERLSLLGLLAMPC